MIKKAMLVMLSIVVIGCSDSLVDPTDEMRLVILNAPVRRGTPQFKIPEFVYFKLTGAPANSPVEFCATYKRPDGIYGGCDTGFPTDSSGTWTNNVQVLGISLGTWTRWVVVNGVESNKVTYTVVE